LSREASGRNLQAPVYNKEKERKKNREGGKGGVTGNPPGDATFGDTKEFGFYDKEKKRATRHVRKTSRKCRCVTTGEYKCEFIL